MVTTERDIDLFKKLSNYSMLSTKQIKNLCFGGIAKTTVLRRLRRLEKEKYIQRLRGLESQEVLWYLLDRGADIAEVHLSKRNWSKNLLEHDFKLIGLRLLLESQGLAHSWIPEHEIKRSIFKNNDFRSAKEKLIPDGFMGIEVNGIKQTLAIELELTLKNKDKLRKVIGRYKEKELHGVWYISPSKSILNSINHQWKNTWCMNKNPPMIYLSLLDDLMKNPLEAKVYGNGGDKIAKELWTPETIRPAHPDALGMGKQDDGLRAKRIDVTNSNHTPLLKTVS
jgi:DNA-binding MarR family transcriptional regulator